MVTTAANLNFAERVGQPLAKGAIRVLQVNVGRRCNLACTHCHVEAGPHRPEEMSPAVTTQVITAIQQFPQIATVDLTGGAPELHAAFRPLAIAAREGGDCALQPNGVFCTGLRRHSRIFGATVPTRLRSGRCNGSMLWATAIT
jgi:MoaA/NifB/PqqE/SkfB family radical SAM enzyme